MQLKIKNDALEQLKTDTLPDVISVNEVGKVLGICRVSVCKQITLGNLKAIKKGRIYNVPKRAVIDFLHNREKEAK